DVWAAYYTATGARQWLHQYGTAYSETVTDAVADASRMVYRGVTTGGNLAGTSAGLNDCWMIKLSSGGVKFWNKQFGSAGADTCNGMGVDTSGGVAFAGSTLGELGGPTAGGDDAFVAKVTQAPGRLRLDARYPHVPL